MGWNLDLCLLYHSWVGDYIEFVCDKNANEVCKVPFACCFYQISFTIATKIAWGFVNKKCLSLNKFNDYAGSVLWDFDVKVLKLEHLYS